MSDAMAAARARQALHEAELDMDVPLERASSVTNEVWLTPRFAVRVNRRPNQRLRREAFLGPLLPQDVGYPGVVAYGGRLGADWLVLQRCSGGPLARAWPSMTTDERRRAVGQLATVLRRLHAFEAPAELPPIDTPQLLSPTTLRAIDPLVEGLARLRQLEHVDRSLIDDLEAIVSDTSWTIEPFAAPTLVHGDLHFENVLWDGYVLTALLDFEYARPAPIDLELDVLLRFCAFPYLHVAADYEHETRTEDYAAVPWWLAEEYPELFSAPQLFERCRIYSIAYDVADALEAPLSSSTRSLPPHHPLKRLERTARGASHLDYFAGKPSPVLLGPENPLSALHDAQVPDRPAPLSGDLAEGGATDSLPRRSR